MANVTAYSNTLPPRTRRLTIWTHESSMYSSSPEPSALRQYPPTPPCLRSITPTLPPCMQWLTLSIHRGL